MKMKSIRKIICVILIIFCATSLRVYSQLSKLDYQVLLETRIDYNDLNFDSQINPNNDMNISDFASISQFYPILKFKDESNGVQTILQLEANIKNYNFDKNETDFSFHELYTQFSLRDKHYLIFGKKRLDWGTGMMWNPTNFYIQKDPLRTQNRLEGIFMINYTYIFSNNDINFYIFPEKEKDDFSFAIKYNFSGNRIDASLLFLNYKERQQFGGDLSYGGDFFTLYSEGVIRNYTKSYKIEENGDLIPYRLRRNKLYYESVVGTSILLNGDITFRCEFRFRSDYLDKRETDYYEMYLPNNFIIYDPISISKYSLFVSSEYKDIYDRWSISLRSFFDPISGQLMFSPLGIWKMENMQVEFSTMIFNNKFSIYNLQTTLLLSYYF